MAVAGYDAGNVFREAISGINADLRVTGRRVGFSPPYEKRAVRIKVSWSGTLCPTFV
ncbi:MAG: hypothetical protein Q4A06_04865 [Cardiobacteriaceae bacterium]|nr:hypothetical protein [Cardiobacteriaceae bacterium]